MRKFWILMLVAVLAVAFIATDAMAAKKKVIAYTGFAQTLPFFIELGKGVKDKCNDLGFDFLNVSPAESKPELQVQGLDNAIIKGVDGIVMSPSCPRILRHG
jgi:ABC-type sugar transport system substrate-binding protein